MVQTVEPENLVLYYSRELVVSEYTGIKLFFYRIEPS
jgi:hypothetical protein